MARPAEPSQTADAAPATTTDPSERARRPALVAYRTRPLLRSTSRILVVALAIVGAAAAATSYFGHTDWRFVPAAIVLFAAIAAVVLFFLPQHSLARFGLPNTITTARAALTALVGALILEADKLAAPGGTGLAWAATAAAGIALALDGLDGIAARYTHSATEFGQRFDKETDALLILCLAALVFAAGKLGAWVLLLGLARYAFLVLGCIWPAMRAPLAESFRRKFICVVQGVVLCTLLAPLLAGWWAHVPAIVALTALFYSFGADILTLARTS